MKWINNRRVYQVIILSSFVGLNLLILLGIGSAWSFFNSGADRASIFRSFEGESPVYQSIKWDLESYSGHQPTAALLKDIGEDYARAWESQSLAMERQDPLLLNDYHTDSMRTRIGRKIARDRLSGQRQKLVTLSHDLHLKHFSVDESLVIFEDRRGELYQQLHLNDTLVYQGKSIRAQRVVMLLEDGFWRIRQAKAFPLKTTAPTEQHSFDKLQHRIAALRGINYYPAETPWQVFDQSLNRAAISRDFALLHSWGMNAVRIFVPYQNIGGPDPTDDALLKLESLLDLAREHELQVILTLFDFYGNYALEDWPATLRHMDKVVTQLRTHPALLAWDLKNEPDLDFDSRGKQQVMAWLETMIEELRERDAMHPITVGWSNASAARLLAKELDFVSFHYYGKVSDFQSVLQQLRGAVDKPILLEEFGLSSYSGLWNVFGGSDKKQEQYHSMMAEILEKEKLPFMIWTLHDFKEVPTAVVGRLPWRKAPQRHFGLLDTKGEEKPSARIWDKN
jgi:hypothetical protein